MSNYFGSSRFSQNTGKFQRDFGSWNENGVRITETPSLPGCRRLRRWRSKILYGAGFDSESPADALLPPGHRPPFSFREPEFFQRLVFLRAGDLTIRSIVMWAMTT